MSLPRPAPGLTLRDEGPLIDPFGRVHTYLRVSVTDRCNYRCTYCMPEEGLAWMPRAEVLSFEEIARIVGVFASLGVRRVRLTGGEPLVRKDLLRLVAALAVIPGLDDLAMTTNGHLLPPLAAPLREAGLRRVNVSCDAIDPDVFRRLTRNGDVAAVLAGVEAARRVGLVPVKVNAVVVAGENEDEAVRLVEHFSRWPEEIVVRFIEQMPFDGIRRGAVAARSTRARLAERFTLVPVGGGDGGPAVDWRVVETGQVVGFISPITEHFCHRCNRLRLEADGHLRTCLSRDDTPSLRDLLRDGASDLDLARAVRRMVWGKVAGHEAHLADGWRAFEGVMTRIGG
ncbi:MAG TPA: GTP 3',8-cyclase MoaA [Myxococcota bacterium]|nr:GTP 3',8-cyclase MoaA [Myxococcota bacterium]